MKMKLLGAAVTAALLGLSTASFGQASGGTSGASGPSGQDTPREAGAAKSGPGSAASGAATGSASDSATSGSSTSGSTVTTNCDSLSGAAKTRCLREQGSSSGSSSAPAGTVTKQPGQSGPGTSDKTDPKNPAAPGVGTSSAGSGDGK